MDKNHLDNTLDIPQGGEFFWYVIHAASGSEVKVSVELRSRLEKAGRIDALKGVFVPKKKVWAVRRGERVEIDEVVFPGYVLVELIMDSEVAAIIQRIPRVMSILGADNKSDDIRALSRADIQSMVDFLGDKDSVATSRHVESFEEGDVVRIKEGLFETMEGDVDYVDRQKLRLKVSVPILGRPTLVDLDFSQVEKVV